MKVIFTVVLLLGCFPGFGQLQPQPAGQLSYADWEVVFEDHFDATHLDTARWRTDMPFFTTCYAYPNHTSPTDTVPDSDGAEYYDTTALALQNGILRITGSRVPEYQCPDNGDRYTFKSGLIRSRYADNTGPVVYNREGFLYGMIEARCLIPRASCFTPAVWMATSSGIWPPEIDLFEVECGNASKNKVSSSVHDGLNDSNNRSQRYSSRQPGYFVQAYHTWTCVWSPSHITFYLDGKELHTQTNPYLNTAPMDVIANLGVHSLKNSNQSDVFSVDYIRVLKPRSALPLNAEAPADAAGALEWSEQLQSVFYLTNQGGLAQLRRDTTRGPDKLPRWVRSPLPSGRAAAVGNLTWSESRRTLFYQTSGGGLGAIRRDDRNEWVFDSLGLAQPTDVGGALAWSESQQRLFYQDTAGRVSHLYFDTASVVNRWVKGGVLLRTAPADVAGGLVWSESRGALFYQTQQGQLAALRWNAFEPRPWSQGVVLPGSPADVAGELTWSEKRSCLFYRNTRNTISHLYWNSWSGPQAGWALGEPAFAALHDANTFRVYNPDQSNPQEPVITDPQLVKGSLCWSEEEESLFFTGPKDKLYRLLWRNSQWNLQAVKWKGQTDELHSESNVSRTSPLRVSAQDKMVFYQSKSGQIEGAHWVDIARLDPPASLRYTSVDDSPGK